MNEKIILLQKHLDMDIYRFFDNFGYIQDIENAMEEYANHYKQEWLEIMQDTLNQNCWVESEGKYDHMCISTFEKCQRELIKHGFIKQSQCYRQ